MNRNKLFVWSTRFTYIKITYCISGVFRVGLIFTEFVTTLKLPKTDTTKNKPDHTSSLRVLEIAKIGLCENLTHLPSGIFAKISKRKKFLIYGNIMIIVHTDTKCSLFWGGPGFNFAYPVHMN